MKILGSHTKGPLSLPHLLHMELALNLENCMLQPLTLCPYMAAIYCVVNWCPAPCHGTRILGMHVDCQPPSHASWNAKLDLCCVTGDHN